MAIDLDPSDALSHRWYAKLLSCKGRHEEAILEAQRALRCDPLSLSVRRDVVETLFAARRYEQTIAEAHQLMEMTGQAPDVQLGLVWVYFLKGDQSKAFHSLCAGFRSLGTGPKILDRVAKAFKSGGMRAVFGLWAKVMEQQAALGQQSIDLLVRTLLGEKDRCFNPLDLAANNPSGTTPPAASRARRAAGRVRRQHLTEPELTSPRAITSLLKWSRRPNLSVCAG